MAPNKLTSRHVRHPVNLFVGIVDSDTPPGRTRNISLSGLFVETATRPQIGSAIDIWFVWGDDTYTSKAKVIRHADDGIGVAFVEPDVHLLDALAEILDLPSLS
ncbi:MAG: PilZ domain-containing protein [Deltaproteobacteria bacterium]|nr:PilZ domain-containing protein [Deltaproteobacteria bacterium]